MSMKNLITPSGIEPATFRLVAHYLKQLRYCVPPIYIYIYIYIYMGYIACNYRNMCITNRVESEKKLPQKCCKLLFLWWYRALWCSIKLPDLCFEATRFESRQWHRFSDRNISYYSLVPVRNSFIISGLEHNGIHSSSLPICYPTMRSLQCKILTAKSTETIKPSIPLKVWVRRPGSKSWARV